MCALSFAFLPCVLNYQRFSLRAFPLHAQTWAEEFDGLIKDDANKGAKDCLCFMAVRLAQKPHFTCNVTPSLALKWGSGNALE